MLGTHSQRSYHYLWHNYFFKKKVQFICNYINMKAHSLTTSNSMREWMRDKKGRDEEGLIIKQWSIQGEYLWHKSSKHAPLFITKHHQQVEEPGHASCCQFLHTGLETPKETVSYLIKTNHRYPLQPNQKCNEWQYKSRLNILKDFILFIV